MTRNVCIIPARMAASRFPGKPLKPLLGLPLVLHVYHRCRLAAGFDAVAVATCDEEIRAAVEAAGGQVVMTADTHPGAVDRTVEAAGNLGLDLGPDDFVLMVQGDEVLVTPEICADMMAAYARTRAPVVNLASTLYNAADHDDPNCVKVAGGLDGRALFFSRSPIPSRTRTGDVPMFQQTGVIGFQRAFLDRFGTLPRTPLEMAEGIDMLRVLEHGLSVQLVFTPRETVGVDTKADLDRAERMLAEDPLTARYLS